MSIVAKRLDGLRYHLERRYRPQPRPHFVTWGPSSPKRGTAAPTFRPVSMAKRSPISATAELLLIMLHTVVVKNGPGHFGTWDGTVQYLGKTVRHLGPNCL